MLNPDGTYSIDGEELATLIAGHEFWWLLPDGATTTTPTRTPPSQDAMYLMAREQPWVDQWGGDWQRACDEQLNPALRANTQPFSPEES